MREQKSLQVPAKTVTVLLSLEVVWQGVPDRRTHNSEGPTAKCGEPVLWYDNTLPLDLCTNTVAYVKLLCCILHAQYTCDVTITIVCEITA